SNRTIDVAATGADGTYTLKIPGAGQYTLKAEFSAFAPATRPVTIDAANCRPRVDVSMTLASRAPAAGGPSGATAATSTNTPAAAPPPLPARPAGGRGQRPGAQPGQPFQNLSLRADIDAQGGAADANAGSDAAVPLPPGFSPDTSSESVTAIAAADANDSIFGSNGRGDFAQRFGGDAVAGDGGPPAAGRGFGGPPNGGGPGGFAGRGGF